VIPIKSVLRLGVEDSQSAKRGQAPFFIPGDRPSDPLTRCSQRPRAYLGSCVGVGKGLDQPVCDARRGAGIQIFQCGDHNHGQLMLAIALLLPERVRVARESELTGQGLPLGKCEAYNRVYDQFYQSR